MTPTLPEVAGTAPGLVEAADGQRLSLGDRSGPWTVMAVLDGGSARARVVFADFSMVDGVLAVVGLDGSTRILPKTSEPTSADPDSLYLGHSWPTSSPASTTCSGLSYWPARAIPTSAPRCRAGQSGSTTSSTSAMNWMCPPCCSGRTATWSGSVKTRQI